MQLQLKSCLFQDFHSLAWPHSVDIFSGHAGEKDINKLPFHKVKSHFSFPSPRPPKVRQPIVSQQKIGHQGLLIKYGGGGGAAAESHLNIGPVYRVGQFEIGYSSKTLLIQETEGEIYRESGILDPFVVL